MDDINGLLASLTPKQREALTDRLDEEIHEAKADEAARINNDGLTAQVEYLELTPDQVREKLAGIV